MTRILHKLKENKLRAKDYLNFSCSNHALYVAPKMHETAHLRYHIHSSVERSVGNRSRTYYNARDSRGAHSCVVRAARVTHEHKEYQPLHLAPLSIIGIYFSLLFPRYYSESIPLHGIDENLRDSLSRVNNMRRYKSEISACTTHAIIFRGIDLRVTSELRAREENLNYF